MLQPTASQSRPPIQHSVFVLSNVDGGTLGGRMYGCCLTAYRKEVEDAVGDADAPESDASGVTVRGRDDRVYSPFCSPGLHRPLLPQAWWPVVLFFLTRYPIVAKLQVVLEHVYMVYDAGVSTGAATSELPPPSFCSLQEYLRMLVFEVPLPVRRAALGIEVLLPGAQPSADAAIQFFLPAPDVMPTLQFDPRAVLRTLGSRGVAAALVALLLERRVVVVAATVQELVETCETLLTLLYPLSWENPYVPVLPVHLASDCMSNPVPFLYGVLESYAASSLDELSPEDTEDIVVIDVVDGHVEVGALRFLARHSRDASADLGDPDAEDNALRLPEPLASELADELNALVADADQSTEPSLKLPSQTTPASHPSLSLRLQVRA